MEAGIHSKDAKKRRRPRHSQEMAPKPKIPKTPARADNSAPASTSAAPAARPQARPLGHINRNDPRFLVEKHIHVSSPCFLYRARLNQLYQAYFKAGKLPPLQKNSDFSLFAAHHFRCLQRDYEGAKKQLDVAMEQPEFTAVVRLLHDLNESDEAKTIVRKGYYFIIGKNRKGLQIAHSWCGRHIGVRLTEGRCWKSNQELDLEKHSFYWVQARLDGNDTMVGMPTLTDQAAPYRTPSELRELLASDSGNPDLLGVLPHKVPDLPFVRQHMMARSSAAVQPAGPAPSPATPSDGDKARQPASDVDHSPPSTSGGQGEPSASDSTVDARLSPMPMDVSVTPMPLRWDALDEPVRRGHGMLGAPRLLHPTHLRKQPGPSRGRAYRAGYMATHAQVGRTSSA